MGIYTKTETIILGVVVGAIFLFLLIQGFVVGRKARTAGDYMLAGRSVGTFGLVMTLVGTATGGSSLLGYTTLAYDTGFSAIWGMASAWIILIIMMFTVVKPIRNVGLRYELKTIPDFMCVRYCEACRLPSALSIVLAYAAISGMQFMAIGTFLEALLGLDYTVGLIIGFLFLTAKSYFGGLRSVVWSDRIMGSLQTFGMVFFSVFALCMVGGFSGARELAITQGRPNFVNWAGMPISEVLMYAFTIGGYQFMRQDTWQRIWAGKSGRVSFVSNWISTIISILSGFFIVIIGACVALGTAGELVIEDTSLFYYYASDYLFPFGLNVVMIAALIATIVSCGDSFLLAGSATTSNDILCKLLHITPHDEKKYLLMSRLGVWITATVGLIMALFVTNITALWTCGTAMLTSGLLLPILCGFYSKKVGPKAGLYATWAGVIASVAWTVIGSPWLHACFVGTGACTVVLIATTLILKNDRPTDEVVQNCYYKYNNSVDDVVEAPKD